jgi:signal transduction histidine kinase
MEKNNEIDLIYWIGTAVMLVFGFGLIYLSLFYNTYIIKIKRKEAELLLKASLESEKKERERIAADLHDSVSSDLSAIRNYLAVILKSEQDDARIAVFTDLKEGVETAIENTRTISYRLMPPLLEKMGLVAALDD